MVNRPGRLRGGRLRLGGGLARPARALSVIGILAAAALAAAAPAPASAGPVPHGKGMSMLVSPPRLTIAARQVRKSRRLEIENRGSVRLNVHVKVENLRQRRDGSSLPEPNGPSSALRWIRVVPSHFYVRPGTRRFVQVFVRIPRRPEPGDHDLMIIFMVPPRSARATSTSRRG